MIFAASSRSSRISTMVALLSLALPLSPRAVKALKTFSRRSRRGELFRNGYTADRGPGTAGAAALADLHEPVLLVPEQVVAEGRPELRQPLVDLGPALLGC